MCQYLTHASTEKEIGFDSTKNSTWDLNVATLNIDFALLCDFCNWNHWHAASLRLLYNLDPSQGVFN